MNNDPNKRSIELPDGCKDLIDVLRLRESEEKPQPIPQGKLADVPHHVEQFMQSIAAFNILCIGQMDSREIYFLLAAKNDCRWIILDFKAPDPMGEMGIRYFFLQRKIAPATDGVFTSSSRSLKYPLAGESSDVVELVSELLRRIYVKDEHELLFFYHSGKSSV